MNSDLASIFDRAVDFDPAADFEPFVKSVPAKWVVYLLADGDDQPVQLLCVKNLRYSLERRLGAADPLEGPSRRVNYREIVRRIYYTRVDSAFEADCVYLEVARQVFPQTYRGMLGLRPAWFVHVNPDTTYPRYIKTNDPTGKTGQYFGPIEDKHAAQKLVHTVESLFDLCRDYSILVQSPNGGPCPWKQMNKCVGPCDGTISLDAYRDLIAYSMRALVDPRDFQRDHERRMKQAATELRFETAERIKAYVEQITPLGKGSFRYVRPLRDFRYITLQRGPRAGTAKVFLILPGRVDQVLALIVEPQRPADVLRHVLTLSHAANSAHNAVDEIGAERMGVVAHHLFQPKAKQGVFLPIDSLDEKSILKAYRDLMHQKTPEETAGEGLTKELQAL